ncbi:MAG: hypothetical protein ACSNEK_08235 [Parachlamydiaceae bacterium]
MNIQENNLLPRTNAEKQQVRSPVNPITTIFTDTTRSHPAHVNRLAGLKEKLIKAATISASDLACSEVFKEALAAVRKNPNQTVALINGLDLPTDLKSKLFIDMAKLCVKSGDVLTAFALITSLPKRSENETLLKNILMAIRELPDQKKIQWLGQRISELIYLPDHLEILDTIQDTAARRQLRQTIAQQWLQAYKAPDNKALLAPVKNIKMTPHFENFLNVILIKLSNQQTPKQLYDFINHVLNNDEPHKLRVIGKLFGHLYQQGHIDMAIQFLNRGNRDYDQYLNRVIKEKDEAHLGKNLFYKSPIEEPLANLFFEVGVTLHTANHLIEASSFLDRVRYLLPHQKKLIALELMGKAAYRTAKSGKTKEARELSNLYREGLNDEQLSAIHQLAQSLASNKPEEADKYIYVIPSSYYRTLALIDTATKWLENGNIDKAYSNIKDFKDIECIKPEAALFSQTLVKLIFQHNDINLNIAEGAVRSLTTPFKQLLVSYLESKLVQKEMISKEELKTLQSKTQPTDRLKAIIVMLKQLQQEQDSKALGDWVKL